LVFPVAVFCPLDRMSSEISVSGCSWPCQRLEPEFLQVAPHFIGIRLAVVSPRRFEHRDAVDGDD
jgi:hypothetical protein